MAFAARDELTTDLRKRRRTGEERADRLEGGVDQRREDFDAREFARETASASFDDFSEQHERGISDMRGAAVGMGRLRTGFADEDEARFTEDMHTRLSRELARTSLHAGQLDLQNTAGMQQAGESARIGADAALAGQLDRADAEVERKRQKRGRLLGVLGGVAGGVGGFLVGGPAGAVAGAKIGSSVGGG